MTKELVRKFAIISFRSENEWYWYISVRYSDSKTRYKAEGVATSEQEAHDCVMMEKMVQNDAQQIQRQED